MQLISRINTFNMRSLVHFELKCIEKSRNAFEFRICIGLHGKLPQMNIHSNFHKNIYFTWSYDSCYLPNSSNPHRMHNKIIHLKFTCLVHDHESIMKILFVQRTTFYCQVPKKLVSYSSFGQHDEHTFAHMPYAYIAYSPQSPA